MRQKQFVLIDTTVPPRSHVYAPHCRTCTRGWFHTHWHREDELWLAWTDPCPVWHIVIRDQARRRWVCLCSDRPLCKYYPRPSGVYVKSCAHIQQAQKLILPAAAG
jgi:hypothetical protein